MLVFVLLDRSGPVRGRPDPACPQLAGTELAAAELAGMELAVALGLCPAPRTVPSMVRV